MSSFVKNNNNNKCDDKSHPHTYAKLLKQFPKIKFSYELKSYKKVYTTNTTNNDTDNVYLIIPKGKKYFVWFKNDECLFLELDSDRQVVSVTSKKTSRIFPNNTIFYGTQFYYRNNTTGNSIVSYYFTIENIHYYNGINVDASHTVFEKLKTLHLSLKTVSLERAFQVEIGLPYIDTSFERISVVNPFYSAYCIQKKNLKNEYQNIFYPDLKSSSAHVIVPVPLNAAAPTNTIPTNTIPTNTIIDKGYRKVYNNTYNNGNNNKHKIFIVSADIQNDIYHLTDPMDPYPDSKQPEPNVKLVASIPDYKTSVMMNSLFRKIKENNSLDALEESDDEDEFENTNIDKFVDLSKKLKMKCIFNHKFKKWTPIECV
jgi:uncharacterized protein YuzE